MKSLLAPVVPSPSQRKGRFASSTARHRHRISVKSKGADLVARKLTTKFGEKAERESRARRPTVAAFVVPPTENGGSSDASGGGGGDGVGEAQKESIPGESRSTLQPALLLLRAILSSRICDHQHAKWIKFLDYTFRVALSLPASDSYTWFRATIHRRLRPLSPHPSLFVCLVSIPSLFQIVSRHLRPSSHPTLLSASFALSSSRVFLCILPETSFTASASIDAPLR